MYRWLLRRLISSLVALASASLIVFGLSRAAGDPLLLYAQPGYGMSPEQREEIVRYLGLDRPLMVQYVIWVGKVLKGDFGKTLLTRVSVGKLIRDKTGATLQLALGAWLFACITGVPFGVLSAVQRGSLWDYVVRLFAILGQAAPQFWLAIVFILLFAAQLGWLPAMGRGPEGQSFGSQIRHLILPSITVGWAASASYLRLTRSAMLEVLDSEYIKFARSKGVAEWVIIWKHAFRNALIAPLTFSTITLATFLTGAVVVETVFGWPGVGRLATRAVWDNDFPLLTATVLVWAAGYVALNFLTDIAYGFIDPRIRQR